MVLESGVHHFPRSRQFVARRENVTVSTPTTAAEKGDALDRITVDQLEAERITGLSYKTLERHHKAGEATGRIKLGRRVLFVRDVLEAWVKSKLSAK